MKKVSLAELDEAIGEMTREAVRIAEAHGWNSETYLILSREIAKAYERRARIRARRRG
jgi:hypothetical protein